MVLTLKLEGGLSSGLGGELELDASAIIDDRWKQI